MKFKTVKDALLVLGIRGEATRDDVKGAYKELLKLYHPDENPSDRTAWQYYDIRDAYDFLMDIFKDERISSVGGDLYFKRPSGSGSVLKKDQPENNPSRGQNAGRIIGNAGAVKEIKERQSQRTKALKKDLEIREKRKAEEELEKRRAEAAFQEAMEKINRIRFAERSAEIISALIKEENKK